MFVSFVYQKVQSVFKSYRNYKDRKRLTNPEVTIITNHCMGGFMYHDLGLQFKSPTINMKILPDDFIEFVEHLEYFLQQEIVECRDSKETYPVGMLNKITGGGYLYLYFVHYTSFNEAVAKWNERVKRVNYDNLVVFMTARDGCQDSTLERFEKLPYKQRICYTNEPHPEYPHCKYARLDNGKPLKGYISDMVNIFGKRAFECNGFDYVSFINGEDQLPHQ